MSEYDWLWEHTKQTIRNNLPTVHRTNYVAPAEELVIDPLLDFEPECEAEMHDKSRVRRATHIQMGCCAGKTGFRCSHCVECNRAMPSAKGWPPCRYCGTPSPSYKWLPLGAS